MALQEGLDFYFQDGLMVLTEDYLKNRGYCCENGCRHCPYGFDKSAADSHLDAGVTDDEQEAPIESALDPEM